MQRKHKSPLSEVCYGLTTRANGEHICVAVWITSSGHKVKMEIKYRGETMPTEEQYAELEEGILTELVMACEADIAAGRFEDWCNNNSAVTTA